MIDLTPHDHAALREIVQAGESGLVGCTNISLRTLIRLEDAGLILADLNLRNVTATATATGRAFSQRDAL